MDMSGFSRQTLRHGIIHFLAQIHRMHSIATPVVESHGGEVIKYEADNIFAVFPEVEQAGEAAGAVDPGPGGGGPMLPPELAKPGGGGGGGRGNSGLVKGGNFRPW